jgi:hypothetical protein
MLWSLLTYRGSSCYRVLVASGFAVLTSGGDPVEIPIKKG